MKLDFNKQALIPAIIQDVDSLQVLMLGYMNQEAFKRTQIEKRVTFYSRKRQCLWTKGETSGNFLEVIELYSDCDNDTVLIKAKPVGPTCHRGTTACFDSDSAKGFLYQLESVIDERITSDASDSYTNKLFKRGVNKVAQKVGEEAVEVVIEAKDNNDDLFKNEVADLLYHLLILLRYKKFNLADIEEVLKDRNN